ncbi:unnamed protein product [Lactuca saligna]|uniref:DUF4283 domain-containing protein n=1 Tax=Lactuca saligna TaxID=75948 RepID=A0AA35Y477_LACSI|nr:unnamed protein product [Lactuca saligna]
MGFIPILSCFPPWQLGVSTLVGATASSISKWWDNYPSIPGIGYVLLKLYHKWVGCFPCNYKNNHFKVLWHKCMVTAIRFIPDFIGNFSFEVDYFILHLGLIPINWCFYPRQLGFSTYVGATASSISKWWDIHPAIHGIGYVNLRLYHLQVGCFLCNHKNNHIWSLMDPCLLIAVWFIPDFIGSLSFEVVNSLKQMGLIPVSWKFLPRQLGISTLVGATASSISKWWDIYPLIHWIGGWDLTQGQFWNIWNIILEDLLKSNWFILGKKEVEDKLKKIWKWWDLLGNNGFSNTLSCVLKIIFWSLLDVKVKIGKKTSNYCEEKIGKNYMKSIVQSSKFIAIIGGNLEWKYLQIIDDMNVLANDSLDLEVPWKHWKTIIIQTLDYLFEYEAIFWVLNGWKIGSFMKIEDFEDFVNWKFFGFDCIVYLFESYVWFHSLLWSWTWKWIAKSDTSLINKFESEASLIAPKIPSEAGNSENSKLDSMVLDSSSVVKNEVIQSNCLNLSSQIAPDVAVLKNYVSPCSIKIDCAFPSIILHVSINSIKKEEESIDGLSQPVIEFEKDIAQFCGPGEKNAMMAFWNGLSINEKEGFVHGLRFTKKKYNSGIDADDDIVDSIDDVKKISLVSQRNEMLLNWKDLTNKKKEKFFHKLCTSKVKKQVEANFGKNRIPFKPSSSLFPSSVNMKKSSDFEASDGFPKVGETVSNLFPEGVPNLNLNEPVIVDLQNICSMQSLVKKKKEKRKIEIDEMVSRQLERVCNEIIYHFPSKFNHIDIVKKGDFNFNYVDPDDKGINVQMLVDENEENKGNIWNSNGGLLITENMMEQMKNGELKSKVNFSIPKTNLEESKLNEPVSYAEKVNGKKLNAANRISKVKKNADLPDGVVEMPICDILKGCSPFKTILYEEVMVNDEGIYFFRFSSKQGMISVLEGGVWMIFDSALVVRRWTTGVSSAKDQHDKVPVWVKIFNVPLEYWNGTGLSHIAWEIGKPLDVDAHTTKMCQEHWGRSAFMRVLIEMSASKEWLKEVHVYSSDLTTGERILSKCKIEYAWNPSKCSHCKVYGHKDSTCGILLAKEANDLANSKSDDQKKDGIKVDLMEVLIASTKKVDDDNEGFQTVEKRNKGIKMGEKTKEGLGNKNHNSFQGQNGKNQGNGKNMVGNSVGSQGQKRNSSTKNGNTFGGNQWNKGKEVQGYNGKNQAVSGRTNGTGSGGNNFQGMPHAFNSFQEPKMNIEGGKKIDSGLKYIPKSGADF